MKAQPSEPVVGDEWTAEWNSSLAGVDSWVNQLPLGVDSRVNKYHESDRDSRREWVGSAVTCWPVASEPVTAVAKYIIIKNIYICFAIYIYSVYARHITDQAMIIYIKNTHKNIDKLYTDFQSWMPSLLAPYSGLNHDSNVILFLFSTYAQSFLQR